MNQVSRDREVIDQARKLGLGARGDTAERIVSYCLRRIEGWIRADGPVSSASELEALVARRLCMKIEEVESDLQLDALIQRYVRLGDGVFAYLKHDLDQGTLGATYRRRAVPASAPDSLVAIIDCRGEKAARRFFTRWHEISHFLIEPDPALVETPVHRASDAPLERLVDEVAARVGFYEPVFGPAFDRVMVGQARLSLNSIEAVRRTFDSTASFQATLFACQRRTETPVIYVEATSAYKADELRLLGRLNGDPAKQARPEPRLRAVQVVHNDAARGRGMFIPPNMRIPRSSVIYRLFEEAFASEGAAQENLRNWEHSGGKRLADQQVWIEARRTRDRVIGIVQALD